MNSLVSADYGSSGDSSDDENTIQTTNFQSNDVKNFLRSASDSENDSNDDGDSNSSTERSKSEYWTMIFPIFTSLTFDWIHFIWKIRFICWFFFSSETKKTLLPSASSILLNGTNNTGEVFNNPYKKAENDQIASLEKHVKMVRSNFSNFVLVVVSSAGQQKQKMYSLKAYW